MPLFKTKPIKKEATKWTGFNQEEMKEFMDTTHLDLSAHDKNLLIKTPEGVMRAAPGDWVIKGLKGEFYPCKPEVFEQSYEPVKDE